MTSTATPVIDGIEAPTSETASVPPARRGASLLFSAR